jgi:hypothetical protein
MEGDTATAGRPSHSDHLYGTENGSCIGLGGRGGLRSEWLDSIDYASIGRASATSAIGARDSYQFPSPEIRGHLQLSPQTPAFPFSPSSNSSAFSSPTDLYSPNSASIHNLPYQYPSSTSFASSNFSSSSSYGPISSSQRSSPIALTSPTPRPHPSAMSGLTDFDNLAPLTPQYSHENPPSHGHMPSSEEAIGSAHPYPSTLSGHDGVFAPSTHTVTPMIPGGNPYDRSSPLPTAPSRPYTHHEVRKSITSHYGDFRD